ncbi:MAG TPA: BTAD domain-containing putative transcriptional regulator, partial [Gemmatimonadaceae bacterium]|nr:BTAD domain-containing putative transcriptional regulator [Gemmatimonadaceae bacterium]
MTFGGLTIENCTGLGAFNARSRLAILAVIAAAGERGIRRDKLIALFWPDADEERGRNALRQSLFALRQRLGGEPLTLGVSELRLNPAALSSDVSDFETAVSGGRFEDAVALYRGAFLDGVHVRDAADLDQWASEQRQRLAAEYGRALETLAARATRQADRARAAEWWRRRVAHDPLSGRVTLGYLSALAAVGDSEAAIRYASTYARRVQQELDAPPDADVMAFAESLRAAPRVSRAPLGAAPAATGATALPERREVSARAPHARRALFVSIAVIAAIFLGGALWHTQTSEGDSTGVVRFALSFSPGAPLANGVGASFAMSPDGRAVVYRGLSGARLVLYVRPLDELRARVLPGTDDGDQPRFSPDGRWVAFIAENHLKKVRIDGSDAVELAPLTNVRGLSWGPKGFIVASADGRLVSVPESGGVPRVLSALDSARGEKAQLWPLVTDDGGTVLYTSWMGSVRDARLGVLSTTSRTARTLDVGGLYPLQVIDGQLVFAGAENELLTSPVAPGGSQPIRAPTRVLSGIEVGPSGGAKAALSRTGALVYLMQPATQLTSVGADGDSHVIIGE